MKKQDNQATFLVSLQLILFCTKNEPQRWNSSCRPSKRDFVTSMDDIPFNCKLMIKSATYSEPEQQLVSCGSPCLIISSQNQSPQGIKKAKGLRQSLDLL